MRLFFVFLISAAWMAPGAASAEIQSALDIMTFEDEFVCVNENPRLCPHQSFQEAVVFKAWSEEEKARVSNYLRAIQGPHLQYFLKTIKSKGITKLHRVTYAANWFNNSSQRRVEFARASQSGILWVDPVTRVIGFSDRFFKGSEFMDPFAGIERKQLNVLHELIHVFDIANGHISTKEEFRKVSGWKWDGEQHFISNIDYKQAMKDWDQVLEKLKTSASAAYEFDRVKGVSYGFPTVYGMTNAHESFAELLTYYILDPSVSTYMSEELMKYFDRVLQGTASNK